MSSLQLVIALLLWLFQHKFIKQAQPCSILQKMIAEAKEMGELQKSTSKLLSPSDTQKQVSYSVNFTWYNH